MSNYLARRACSVLSRNLPNRSIFIARSIHLTPVVQKKKSKIVVDELFSEEFVEEDLIKATKQSSKVEATETPASVLEKHSAPVELKKGKLTPAARTSMFESQLQYLEPRLGRRPEVENPRIRKRSLITLVQLATSEEELKKVSELLPKYKAAGLDFRPYFAEAFARRCDELACPLLALEVFGNYAKNNLTLTLEAGQWLVHSLAVHEPHHVQVALALFNIYKLPPIAQDLTTASMVAGVYSTRVKSPKLKEIAQELRQPISEMLKKTNISKAPNPLIAKKNNWIAWSLSKANKSQMLKGGAPFVDPTLIPAGNKFSVERPTAQP